MSMSLRERAEFEKLKAQVEALGKKVESSHVPDPPRIEGAIARRGRPKKNGEARN